LQTKIFLEIERPCNFNCLGRLLYDASQINKPGAVPSIDKELESYVVIVNTKHKS